MMFSVGFCWQEPRTHIGASNDDKDVLNQNMDSVRDWGAIEGKTCIVSEEQDHKSVGERELANGLGIKTQRQPLNSLRDCFI